MDATSARMSITTPHLTAVAFTLSNTIFHPETIFARAPSRASVLPTNNSLFPPFTMATTTAKTAAPKAAPAGGVKKAGPKKGSGKSTAARTAMVKMQAYFKENRPKYSKLEFKEQQKALGKDWKTSSENPKNSA